MNFMNLQLQEDQTMTKEKQIEEMAFELENHTCMSQFQAEIASKMLYALNYRKASEVAEEIIAILKSVGIDEWRYPVIAEIKEKYKGDGE